jgi:hypothetical protein
MAVTQSTISIIIIARNVSYYRFTKRHKQSKNGNRYYPGGNQIELLLFLMERIPSCFNPNLLEAQPKLDLSQCKLS